MRSQASSRSGELKTCPASSARSLLLLIEPELSWVQTPLSCCLLSAAVSFRLMTSAAVENSGRRQRVCLRRRVLAWVGSCAPLKPCRPREPPLSCPALSWYRVPHCHRPRLPTFAPVGWSTLDSLRDISFHSLPAACKFAWVEISEIPQHGSHHNYTGNANWAPERVGKHLRRDLFDADEPVLDLLFLWWLRIKLTHIHL